MSWLNAYILFIIILKIIFVFLTFITLYNRARGKKYTEENQTIMYWKERTEFVFIIAMAGLLIYVFNPRSTKPVPLTSETRLLFYLFGFVILLTADWDIFFDDKNVVNIIRKELI